MERFATSIQIKDLDAINPNLTYVNDGIDFNRVVDKLAAYEDIGYEPDELSDIVENYKRLQEAYDKQKLLIAEYQKNIENRDKVFTVHQLKEWTEAHKDGRLFILPKNLEPVNPCYDCDVGWGSISSNGKSSSCHDECLRRKEYIEKLLEYERNKES